MPPGVQDNDCVVWAVLFTRGGVPTGEVQLAISN